ncbi:hypothetical protein BVRB_6g150490 [Beta vulgaris subsp. vulgaris]|nr:hypothetical protein BVRB_6g150490 [Beta vulgaris subsp. vulgaris]
MYFSHHYIGLCLTAPLHMHFLQLVFFRYVATNLD